MFEAAAICRTGPRLARDVRVPQARRIGPPSAVLIFAAWCLLCIVGIGRANAEENILSNGDLTKGTGDAPADWRSEGWQNGPELTTYRWYHRAGAPGVVEVSNAQPNDARWTQTVHLTPGWYHFTAAIRTEGVGENNTGANLSVLEDGIISEQLHGTNDWQTVGFYLKAGASGADIVLACRLGGYASLNTGKAFCRDLRGIRIEEPPADKTPRYELDVIRNVSAPASTSTSSTSENTTQVTILLLLAVVSLFALFGWPRLKREPRAEPAAPETIAPAAMERPMPLSPSDDVRQKTEIALLLVCILSFAYFYQASDHSTASRIDLIRSILERRSLWIDGFAGFNTADIIDWSSHIYSNKAPGGAFTGIIPWLFFSTILKPFLSPPSGMYWALATHLTTVFSVSLIAAMLSVVMYRFGLLLGAGNGRAVAMALTLSFGTIMFPHATEFTAEPIAAFCSFAAFYLLALGEDDGGPWRSLAAGLLAGWAVLCDYPTFLLAVGVALYALWKLKKAPREIALFAAGAAAVAGLLMAYNELAFGNPFFLSYEAYMRPGNTRFPEQAAGFAGVTYPRLHVLWDVLFDPKRGLFFCNPVLLLPIPGLVFFWRRRTFRPEFAVLAFSILSFTLLNASYGNSIIYWGGGTATGPRHMVPVLPFMVLAIVFLPDELNSTFAALALVSAFLMLMVTAVEPHLPYEYENPFRDFIWPAYLRGDLAYNKSTYFGGPPIAGDSVAFNLGKLIGLPGAIQLWPLAAMWVAAAMYFLRESAGQLLPRRTGVAAALATAALFAPPTLGALFERPRLDGARGLLGCYYEGLRPVGFPPHIRRLDRQINFDDIVQLGALPSPSSVVWTGKILTPATGLYQFAITVDDAGWLKIDGHEVIKDPGEITKMEDAGSIYLTAGSHSIEVGERNIWGGASMHLKWQAPGGAQEPVPSQYLTPEGSSCREG